MRNEKELRDELKILSYILQDLETKYSSNNGGNKDYLLFKKERIQARLQAICWVLDISPSSQEV